MTRNALSTTLLLLAALVLSACAPKVGDARWCYKMEEKPKGEWTLSEAGSYARHCVAR